MKQEDVWEKVSRNCLKGNPVPEALKALWKEELSGNKFLNDWFFDVPSLIDTYPDDIFQGYTAEFIGSQKDGDAWNRMFEEIGFFAMEEDGGLIGLWFYSPEIDSTTAPVIQLDNEGQLEIISESIRDYPAAKAWQNTEGSELDEAYKKVCDWSSKHNLGDLVEIDSLSSDITGYPNPNDRFDDY